MKSNTLASIICCFLSCTTLFSAHASTTYRVPKIDSKVAIDGVLDDDAWSSAVKVEANIEVRPGENVPSPVDTEVYIAYDEENIYVAFMAYDPEPDKIRAHISDRDKMWDDDWVLILFDTFNDNRRSYDFSCNPFGIQADEIESDNGGGAWDAIWDSAGKITDKGYVVEMAIPFNNMSIQDTEGEQTWSFDAVRSYPRKVRHHIGAFPRDRSNNCYLCQSVKLVGFEGVKGGKNIEVSPTFSTTMSQSRDELDNGRFGSLEDSHNRNDAGVTAQWGVAKNMTLSMAINPDFSQIEADAAQMDINNRFPLWYSERRPFFLENSDFYRVGDLVHTRTLADPEWGLRLTGKSGRSVYGIFTVRDSFTPLVFSGPHGADTATMSLQSSGTVMRYRCDVGKSSHVGLLVTDREGDGYHNRMGHVDAVFKFTETDLVDVGFGLSNTQYPGDVADEFEQHDSDFGDYIYFANYRHDTKNYGFQVQSNGSGKDYRADLGFITQTGYRYSMIKSYYEWHDDGDNWFTWMSVSASYDDKREENGEKLYQAFTSRLQYNGPLMSYAGVYGEFGSTRYENREFRRNKADFWAGFKPVGWLEYEFSGFYGDEIDYSNIRLGRGGRLWSGLDIKAGDRMSFNIGHNIAKLDVDPGRLFTANVSNFKVVYQFSRRMFLRGNFQYTDYRRNTGYYDDDDVDPRTKRIFTQLLFSYKINPRTVFFLGYSDNYRNRDYRDSDRNIIDDSMIQTNRAIFTKIGYAWNL